VKETVKFAQIINIFSPEATTPPDINFDQINCDIIALKFNIENLNQISIAIEILKNSLPKIKQALMIQGCEDDEIDKILIPELIKNLDRENCIISYANETTYKNIIPQAIDGNHYVVLKTPIDINLAKELNILATDMGLELNRIIMNTDIGGLGYGFEYGFSMMEKIKQEAAKGDEYLDLPILSDVSTESLKTKEAKSNEFSDSWGDLNTRAKMIELSACAGVISAGANIITVHFPENIPILKGLV